MILIPFSSGLDSTTLVQRALIKKEKFELCYISITNNKEKTRVESQQRKKIIRLFEQQYNTYLSDCSDIEISVRGNSIISLPQVPAWIMGLLYSIDSSITEVRMGYCMNDDAVSYVEDIKKIWKAYQSISEQKLPRLTFPLLKTNKQQSKRELPNDIFQETFFCENPSTFKVLTTENEYGWTDCGRCGACERAKYDGTFLSYQRNQRNLSEKAKFSSTLTPAEAEPMGEVDMEELSDEMTLVSVPELIDDFELKKADE